MKENRAVSTGPLKVGDWVWVKDFGKLNPVTGPARIADITDDRIMVEFPTADPRLHGGNGIAEGKAHRCWFVFEDSLAPLPMDFCVFHNEGTTYCLRGDKRNVTGKAQFSAAEFAEFDPLVGAIIAMARAYGRNPTEVAYKVLTVLSAAPQPGIKVTPASNLEERVADLEERVDFLTDWCTALTDDLEKKDEPIGAKDAPRKLVVKGPGGKRYGVVGTRTQYFTEDGIELHVGDRVILELKEKKRDWIDIQFNTLVVEDEDGAYLMGIGPDCDPKAGAIKDWKVTLHPEQLKAGDGIDIGSGRFAIEEEEA